MIRVSPWPKNGRSKPVGLTCDHFYGYGEPTKTEDCTSSGAQMCEKSEVFVGGIAKAACSEAIPLRVS